MLTSLPGRQGACFRTDVPAPAFVCATLFALLLETCLNKSWEIGATSKILGQLGSKYTMYSIALPILPAAQAIPHRITLTLSNFVSLVFAELPYILAYVDLELCPSLFTTHGLISLAICSSTVADIYIFNGDSQRYLPQVRIFDPSKILFNPSKISIGKSHFILGSSIHRRNFFDPSKRLPGCDIFR